VFLPGITGQIRLRCYLDSLANVSVCSGTVGAFSNSITSAFLHIVGRDMTSNPALQNKILIDRKKMGVVSHAFLTPVQMQRLPIPTSSTSFSVTLSSLIGNFSHLVFVLRKQADLTTAGAQTYVNYQSVDNFAIKSSNGTIISGVQYPGTYVINTLLPRYFQGDCTDIDAGLGSVAPKYIYSQVFSATPQQDMEKGTQTGSYNFTGFESLSLTWNSATSYAYYLDVIGYQFKYLHNDANGNLKITNA
jgi:hypothetical protein